MLPDSFNDDYQTYLIYLHLAILRARKRIQTGFSVHKQRIANIYICIYIYIIYTTGDIVRVGETGIKTGTFIMSFF